MKAFASEVADIYKTETHPPKRGALITAAMKRLQGRFVCDELFNIADNEQLDLTAVLAGQLIKALTGRSMAMPTILESFSSPGRTAANKSKDFQRIDELVEKYQPSVLAEIEILKNRAKIIVRQEKEKLLNKTLYIQM